MAASDASSMLRFIGFRSSLTRPPPPGASASRFSSPGTVAGRLAKAQLRSNANRGKNLSRDQFTESHDVTNEQQLSRRHGLVSRVIRE
jgi:hypothetical protein